MAHSGDPALRVALMLESDGPGGAEVMLLHLAEALRDRGHHVTPVGPADGCGWLPTLLRERGFEPETFRLRGAMDPLCVRDLARLLRRRGIDLVHSHEFSMAVYGAAAARLAGRAHVITMHGGTYWTRRWRRRAALRWALRHSHAAVAVAEATRAALQEGLGPIGPIHVIPNGVAPHRPRDDASAAGPALESGAPLILAVGNLYPVKGHAVLLEALGILRRADPALPWRAVIVGRGREEERLRRIAALKGLEDRIDLAGFRSDVADLLAAADVFVLPSLSEGLPLALLEAMAAGKAVVASRVGGVPEAARADQEALLVRPGDAMDLAEALRRLLIDPDLRARLGRNARLRAGRRFGVAAMADAYERVYRSALGAGRSPAVRNGRPVDATREGPARGRGPAIHGARPSVLRVQHIIAPAAVGGAEAVVRALAAGQRAGGHRVAVTAILSDDTRPPFLGALEDEGVEVFRVRVGARAYLRERAEVAALWRDFRPHVVHTHGYRADVVEGALARRLGVPAVTTLHGFCSGNLKSRVYHSVQRRAVCGFDAIVAVSKPLAEDLARTGVPRPRLHVIPNAWTAGGTLPDRDEARRALGIGAGGFHVVWVGRLAPEKGPDLLLDALDRLDGAPLTLHMIGDGRLGPALRARTAGDPRVRWHGMVPDAGRLLRAFDVVVLSSRTEGTPIILLEAMAADRPVIATRVGGIPDVVGDREALLVPPSDPDALAAALRHVHVQPARAAELAQAAGHRLRTAFDPVRWLGRYDDVYRRILSPHHAARPT